jgi:transposase-like protein
MNIIEISNKFPTELSCIEYAEELRFGDKVKCAYCGSEKLSKRRKDNRHKCNECNKSTSVTVNTNIHDTRLPLKTWFFAVSIITDAKKGLSALQLQRNLNISYPTAFSMYHKLRELMMIENKGIDELEGICEMDETYIGGKPRKFNDPSFEPQTRKHLDKQIDRLEDEGFDFKPKGKNKAKYNDDSKRGRGTSNIPVVGIVERDGNVVAEVMKVLSYDNLKGMVKKYVDEDESVLITDNYKGYNSMKKIIDHVKIDHKKLYSYRGVNSNSIESFWAIIERGIMGQYHSVSPKMLPNYVAEFVYKYNNRNDTEGMFYEMLRSLLKKTD